MSALMVYCMFFSALNSRALGAAPSFSLHAHGHSQLHAAASLRGTC